MKILVNGTSVNIGPHTWPNHLQKKLNCEIINLSRGYAGNTYIHDSTLSEISERTYDLVIINWTFFGRADFKTKYLIPPTDEWTVSNPNYHLLQKNWLFGKQPNDLGEIANYTDPLIKHHELVCNNKILSVSNTLTNVISLQSILKSQNIPYVFSFYFDTHQTFTSRYPRLCQMIDWDHVHPYFLHSIAKNNNWWDDSDNDGHPTEQAHQYYADLLLDHINTKNLIKS